MDQCGDLQTKVRQQQGEHEAGNRHAAWGTLY